MWKTMDRSLYFILKNLDSKKVVIVGAGFRGKELEKKLLDNQVYPLCFFDNKKEIWTDNKQCIPIQGLTNLPGDIIYIIAVDSKTAQEQLRNQLLALGINEKMIFMYYASNYEFWKNLDSKYYQDEISALYKVAFDKEMDWKNPKTYNEKINWEKINVKDPIRTRLADKYLVREWVKEKIGSEYLNALYGVWDNANDIDFDKLPESFVLKCNHGSGWNIIVKDKTKLDVDKTRKQLNIWLGLNTAYMGFEMQYKDIPPRIICERYLEGMAESVYDYNIYCFHGKPKYIWCIKGSHRPGCLASFYDTEWNMQEFNYGYPYDPVEAPRPNQLEKMLELSEILCQGFKHVRVDWYNMPDGKVIFGEMTFSTWNGLKRFEPEDWDDKFGRLI